MATEIGPMVATAFCRSCSEPRGMSVQEVRLAPLSVALYKHLGPVLPV